MGTDLNTTSRRLLRWSGAAAALGGACVLQAPLLHPEETAAGYNSPVWEASHFALYAGYVLVQLGLVGILVRQLRAGGRLGVIGFAVAFVGAGLTLMEGRDHIYSLPILRMAGLQGDSPGGLPGLWGLLLSALLFSVGHVLLGAAAWRARVLPRGAAALLAVGAPIFAFSPPIPSVVVAVIGGALYGGGLLWTGYSLFAADGSEEREDGRVEAARMALAAR